MLVTPLLLGGRFQRCVRQRLNKVICLYMTALTVLVHLLSISKFVVFLYTFVAAVNTFCFVCHFWQSKDHFYSPISTSILSLASLPNWCKKIWGGSQWIELSQAFSFGWPQQVYLSKYKNNAKMFLCSQSNYPRAMSALIQPFLSWVWPAKMILIMRVTLCYHYSKLCNILVSFQVIITLHLEFRVKKFLVEFLVGHAYAHCTH